MKNYLARLRTRAQNERGLVTLEYLAIAVLIGVVVVAVVTMLRTVIPEVETDFTTLITDIFTSGEGGA